MSVGRVLIVGAGAVGCTVGAWLKSLEGRSVGEVIFFDQPAVAQSLREYGLITYAQSNQKKKEIFKVKVFDRMEDLAATYPNFQDIDLIIITVKNYSLEAVCQSLSQKFKYAPTVLTLQNGLENQRILPKYFKRVIYGVVSYNCWIDAKPIDQNGAAGPVFIRQVGYQKRGPLVLGYVPTSDENINEVLKGERDRFVSAFSSAVPCVATDRLQDAVLSKMIINLTNSLTTLIGHGFQKISDEVKFQKLLTGLTYEGVRTVKAAGHKEFRMSGMPSWLLMGAAARLPHWLTKQAFRKNVRKMVVSSMAQDIIQKGIVDNELESINGVLLRIAQEKGVAVPISETIYRLCQQKFSQKPFVPMSIEDVWSEVPQQTRD